MSVLLPILYSVGLYSAYIAGSLYLKSGSTQPSPLAGRRVFHLLPATRLLLLMVAIPTILQFFFPALLTLFRRDYERFLSGDWWRLITPLLVQDGGVPGAIFNLVTLLLVGLMAEPLWGSRCTLLLFFIGGIIGEMVAFAWQPVGAGNSVANFSLAAGVAVAVLVRQSPKPTQLAALIALAADGLLVGLQDIHGAAAMAGALLALILNRWRPRRDRS